MAKGTKVYLLAKELGVQSKAIVEKCQAEGLDMVTNHMSPISIGLAATIREWFSEGSEHATAVEKSEHVDLEKVRVKKPKPAPVEEPAPEQEIEQPAEAVAVAEAEPETAPQAQAAEVPAQATETPLEAGAAEPPQAPQETPPAEPVIEAPAPKPEPEQPKEPEKIMPAGPMLEKPKPAVLTGPTVIRVEKMSADDHRAAGRRRPGPRPFREAPAPAAAAAPLPMPDSTAKGKKAGKAKTRGRKKEDFVDESLPHHAKADVKRMRSRDVEERQARLAAASGESLRAKPSRRIEARRAEDVTTPIERPEKAVVSEPILVKDLSAALAVKVGDIIGKLMSQGIMATANQAISTEAAEMVALEFGTELIVERKKSALEDIEEIFDKRQRTNLAKRPPIVTMLGHVDHGKTSLLDRIRKTDVAAGEAGGITQHIGAYQVELNGKKVTFLDTPGHEAFTAMRARGANMTDIVVLVVAADDGLMPQSIEAIHHAKAAGVSIIVALNKIDLPGVDINRIYGQLAEQELTPAEWGGNTEIVKTSAVTGQGVEELIEHLDYMAELNDYQADSDVPPRGWVVESKMSQTKGPVATLLVKEGTLEKGSIVLAGGAFGRVRTMTDSRGKGVKSAGPAMPVEITGLDSVPSAGDKFFCLEDFNKAKDAAEQIKFANREETLARRSAITLDNLFSQIAAGNVKELNIIVKADVQGSVDVLMKYLTELSTEEVKVKIIHAAVGGVSEGDVVLAEASDAIIIGFNVVPDERVRQIAESKKVDIRLYSIIYRITEDLKAAMTGLLEPEFQEKTQGRLVVRNTFKVSSVGTIAGCYVSSGLITNKSKLKLIRNGIVVRDNCAIESLKHFKDDVREVKAGLECGLKVANFDDVKIGDEFEAYEVVEVARTL